MANLYENIPEMQAQALANEQKRKIAEAMMAQGMEAQTPYTSAGRYVVPMHWTQGLAKVAQAMLGAYGLKKAQEGDAGLAKQYQDRSQKAYDDYVRESQGSPSIPPAEIMPTNGGPPRPSSGPSQPGVEANPVGAYIKYAGNPAANPQMVQAEGLGIGWKRQDAAAAVEQAIAERALAAKLAQDEKESARASEDRRSIAADNNARARENAALVAATAANRDVDGGAKFQSTDSAGNVTFYDKSGAPIATNKGAGKPSATFEKSVADKKKMGRDLDMAISEFEKIIQPGGLIETATGSGIGKAADWTASVFGHANKGAIAIGQLQPIFDMGLKMVPRFEGPQSDKDTESYRQAAGNVANPAIPADQKMAAAKVMLDLWKKRKSQFTSTDVEASAPVSSSTDDDWKPVN